MKKNRLSVILGLFLLLFNLGCEGLFTPTPAPVGYAQTLAAQTWEAIAGSFTATNTPLPPADTASPQPIPPTEIPLPTRTATGTPITIPSFTPYDTPTVVTPSATPTQTDTLTVTPTNTQTAGGKPTATPLPCDYARLVAQVTIPEDTVLPPGTRFRKVWRIMNIGSCTWDPDEYVFAIVDGNPMGASLIHQLNQTVRPGEVIDIGVDMIAPMAPGPYSSKWMLRSDYGYFGDRGIKKKFEVKIIVQAPISPVIFALDQQLCTTSWKNGNGDALLCPAENFSQVGFISLATLPLEDDPNWQREVLYTQPQIINRGKVTGVYPYLLIPPNARFATQVGCLARYTHCDVLFQVSYRILGGGTFLAAQQREKNDGLLHTIEIPLDTFANQYVSFILTVKVNTSPEQSGAFWLRPRLETIVP